MNKEQLDNTYVRLCTELGELSHKQNLINARMDQIRRELVNVTTLRKKLLNEAAAVDALESLKSEESADSQ